MVENETGLTTQCSKNNYRKKIPFVIPKVTTLAIIIDNHMAVIQVYIEKNTMKEVLLDCGFRVNIIT